MAEKIGDIIRARIDELGYTQKQVGEKIHRSQKTIQSLLNSTTISSQRLIELSEVLNCNLFLFFTRPGGPLERFAPESCDEIRNENVALKEKVSKLEDLVDRMQSDLDHQREVVAYMKQTLEIQQAYIQNMSPNKDK
ncbi:helix-turn-helix domain-containing protein [Arachidicoccus terrestris]|uniref:helix-turn-helix domain-containing protein n=1 Tax=Arachidicoccus terrestris TaxID=2875539 RepID=UPI001CC5C630|nr:helix-turn-helix transcriptional regulator [Arachidicoccus terrestris]UAY56903.1 helix-turn-helix domain-containing protein [Arachidicoccus terrestris]